jgi:hypothetical protein
MASMGDNGMLISCDVPLGTFSQLIQIESNRLGHQDIEAPNSMVCIAFVPRNSDTMPILHLAPKVCLSTMLAGHIDLIRAH